MNYQQMIEKLFEVNINGGVKLGLENIRRMQELLGYPDRTFKTIHIAGTNGKGSVSTKIARALEISKRRVGLYTSPHISSFRERVQINGEMIPEERVTELLKSLFKLAEVNKIQPTFFELTTLLALLYFCEEKVDLAVLETGLGGRLDATNIVSPCLSVITSISLEHVDILGSSIEAIAKEKGGIIKKGVPVVIGPHVPLKVITEIADNQQSPCYQIEGSFPLYEEENKQIARVALQHVSSLFPLSPNCIEQGIKEKPPCRFEYIRHNPPLILDVAHNPDGIRHLIQMIDFYHPQMKVRFIIGLSQNKDLEGCMGLIAGRGSRFHLIEASNGRGVLTSSLYKGLCRSGISSSLITEHSTIQAAVNQAQKEAQISDEAIVACGSFFIMSEIRRALKISEPHDRIDLNERGKKINK